MARTCVPHINPLFQALTEEQSLPASHRKAHPERSPVLTVKINRGGNIPHLFTGITIIDLHQNRLKIFSRRQSNRIVKYPFGTIAHFVFFQITSQRFAEAGVVSRQVTVSVNKHRKK